MGLKKLVKKALNPLARVINTDKSIAQAMGLLREQTVAQSQPAPQNAHNVTGGLNNTPNVIERGMAGTAAAAEVGGKRKRGRQLSSTLGINT